MENVSYEIFVVSGVTV